MRGFKTGQEGFNRLFRSLTIQAQKLPEGQYPIVPPDATGGLSRVTL
jgi:hypothetical protein